MFVHDSGELGPRRFIINFPTKEHWRSPSRLADIRSGLVDLVATVRRLEINSLAVPALGCGNGGLEWSVRPLIEEAFADLPDVRVLVVPPAAPPPASVMPVATPKPRLTVNRAALLLGMDRYLGRARTLAPRDGISELETQKVAYFLQELGQPSRLVFVRGRYGPYAEPLHHVLQELEGYFIAGYGDRTARVTELRPLRLVPDVAEEAAAWLDGADPGAASRISRLLDLVDGFESPYSLELLATAHFAAHLSPAASTAAEVAERVTSWNPRKARLFTRPTSMWPSAGSATNSSCRRAGAVDRRLDRPSRILRPDEASSLFRAWIDAVEAECLTRCGDTSGALAVLHHAEQLLVGESDRGLPDWMDWFTPLRLAAFKGNTQLAAGQVRRARETLTAVLDRLPAHDAKQRSVIAADLAAVEVAAEDVPAACSRVGDALDALAAVWYATGMERVRQVRRTLQPWQSDPCVRELDDRLYGWTASLSAMSR